MRKTSSTIKSSERNGVRILAALALTGSLAAFGCSTNKVPGNGEPAMSAPAAGSVAPNSTSTPGSSSGATSTTGATPQAMISSSPANGFSASADAIATLKADEAFKGKYLGEAAPNDGTTNTSASMQQVTGQFIPPSAYANPQVTVNSSISSPATPAIVSGAGEGIGGGGGVTVAALPGATTSALTNTTATPITNANAIPATHAVRGVTNTNTAIATNNRMINTGIATAPAAASNVTATPVAGALTNAAASVKTTPTTSTTRATAVSGSTGISTGLATTPLATRSSTTSTTKSTSTTSTPAVRVVNSNGTAIVTNAPPSAFQRFMSAIGLRRTSATTSTTTTTTTTTTPAATSNQ